MRKQEVIKLLRENMDKIESFGVKRIGIFGSAVRDQLNEKSDIDIVVEFEQTRGGLKDFIGVIDFLEELFNREVDVLTVDSIDTIRIKSVRERIKKEVEYV